MQKFDDLRTGKGKLPDDVVNFLLSENFAFHYNKNKMFGPDPCVFVVLHRIENYSITIVVSKTHLRCRIVGASASKRLFDTEIAWDGKNLVREYERILEFVDTTILEN